MLSSMTLFIRTLFFALVGLATAPFLSADAATQEWVDLIDPELSHWELWMGVPHETVTGLPKGTAVSADGKTGIPLGLANDPLNVFSVIKQDGELVLKITGEIYGGLTTVKEFSNYHLRLETKWGKNIWEPRLTRPRDSGLLFHCTGAHGAFWNVWMSCIELQVEQNNFGDLYCLAGTSAQVAGKPRGNLWAYDPQGELKLIGSRPDAETLVSKRSENHEKEGQWNQIDLYVLGDRAYFLTNGHVVHALLDTELTRAGVSQSLTSGKLPNCRSKAKPPRSTTGVFKCARSRRSLLKCWCKPVIRTG